MSEARDEPEPEPRERWMIAARMAGCRILKRLAGERRSRAGEPRTAAPPGGPHGDPTPSDRPEARP